MKSNHPEILEQGFEALYNLRTIDENLALTIYERLQRLDGSDLQYMLNHIPYQAFYDYEMLRKLLNTNDRLRLTIELYENSTDEKQKESYFQQMKEWISNDHASIDDSVLEKLPEEMAVLEEIWPYVPVSKKVETLIKQIESKSERDVHLLQELRTYLNDKKYIKRLTPSIKMT